MSDKHWNYAYPVLACLLLLALLSFGHALTDYLYLLLLFLPLLDAKWALPRLRLTGVSDFAWVALSLLSIAAMLILHPRHAAYFLEMLVFAAVPEEWFFRAYLLARAGFGLRGNIIVSAAFAVLHAVSLNSLAVLLVFAPSLVFGWVYDKTRNFYLTALLHALSNLVFVVYVKDWLGSLPVRP